MGDSNWFYAQGSQPAGPVTFEALRGLLASRQVAPDSLVWTEGMATWLPANQAPALAGMMPPPVPAVRAAQVSLPPPAPAAQPVLPYAQPPPIKDLGQDAGMRLLLPVGRSGWAIAAGYLGLLSFFIVPAPIALIVSIIAIAHLKRRPDKHGWGRALFGLIMGLLGSAVLIVAGIGTALGRN